MLRRWPKLLRIAGWTGVAISLGIAIAWVVTLGGVRHLVVAGRYSVSSLSGKITFYSETTKHFTHEFIATRRELLTRQGLLGRKWYWSVNRDSTLIECPHWFPMLIFLVPSVTLLVIDARKRRRSPTACTHCGYDRSGLAPGSPCPECGRFPGAKS
jgi:hypothetical protein